MSSRPSGALPYEPAQVPSKGTPPESPHPPIEDIGKAPLDKQSSIGSSVTLHGLPLRPDNRATAAISPPSLPQPVSAPRRLDKSNFRLIGSVRVQREATQATEEPALDKKERKGAAAPEEYETRPKDFGTRSDGANRRTAEANPPTSYTDKQTPTDSAAERTYSSNPSRGSDPSAARSSEMERYRGKVGQSTDSAPPLGRKESYYKPPPSAPTQIQLKHSNEVYSVAPQPLLRLPSVTDSIVNTPLGKSPSFLTVLDF